MRKMKLFGKSLTISMLKHYYDILQKDNFVSLLYYFGVHLDAAYLIASEENPAANTLSISLGYRF